LGKNIPFREAISALHDVVISDLRYKKPEQDKSEYLEWARQQEQQYLEEMAMQREGVQQRAKLVRKELQDIYTNQSKLLAPYNKARNEWRQYVWKTDKDLLWVLDPVITVHPDEIFFECFSVDESMNLLMDD